MRLEGILQSALRAMLAAVVLAMLLLVPHVAVLVASGGRPGEPAELQIVAFARFSIVVCALGGLLAGYLTARWRSMTDAWWLAVVAIPLGMVLPFVAPAGGTWPAWYDLGLPAVMFVTVLLGGYLGARRAT